MNSTAAIVQPDFFIGNVADLPSLRDDLDIMSSPFFSLEKGRKTPLEWHGELNGAKTKVVVTGADYGIANQYDNDPLLYIRSGIIDARNRGKTPGRVVRFPVYDLLKATKRGTSGRSYQAFGETLQRLKATSIITNVSKDGWTKDRGVSWIDSYEFVTKETKNGPMMAGCEIELSEWTFAMMVDTKRAISIDPAYFDLTSALERKLYGIVRRQCGNQPMWCIGMAKLKEWCGSSSEDRMFRFAINKIIARQPIPGYHLELTDRAPPMNGRPVLLPSTATGKRLNIFVARPTHRLIGV